jgi:hypothetical protein
MAARWEDLVEEGGSQALVGTGGWGAGAPHPGSPSFRNGISLDQLLAEKIGSQTRFPSIAMAQGTGTSFSYSRSGVAIPAEPSVARMFAKLFINGTPAEGRGGAHPPRP